MDQYRHCKPIFALGAGALRLFETIGVSPKLPDGSPDPGIVCATDSAAVEQPARELTEPAESEKAYPNEPSGSIGQFLTALARRRHFEREEDPPPV